METDHSSDSLNIPPSLLAEIHAAAQEEHRPASDILRDAVERYMRDRRWQRLFAYGEQRARDLGLGEEAIPQLIAEYRRSASKAER